MADIVLDHVKKTYPDGSTAVSDINLQIADGEFVILVGPSGCGKSTTLNMIAGLEDISSGELRIGGERVNERAPKDRDIAMVFQSYALYPHMTVRENIAFPLKLAKLPKDQINAAVEDAARTLDLTQHLDRRPSQLSGGQRQRVAMGRANLEGAPALFVPLLRACLDPKPERRPSGTSPSPRRAALWLGSRPRSWPLNVIEPLKGSMPQIHFTVVVLPMPLRPISATTSPSAI